MRRRSSRAVSSALALALLVAAGPAPADTRAAAAMAGIDGYEVPLRAPGFRLSDLDGALRAKEEWKGRVVVLAFWASWCAPCVSEFPSLERLQAQLGGADFSVVAVTVRDSAASVKRFLKGRDPGFPILFDEGTRVAQSYRAAGIPVTYILDRQGRIVAGKSGPHEWDEPETLGLIRELIAAGGGA